MNTIDDVVAHFWFLAQGIADALRKTNKKGVMIMCLKTNLLFCATGAVCCMLTSCSYKGPKSCDNTLDYTFVESNYKLPAPDNNLISFLVENVDGTHEVNNKNQTPPHDDNFKYILGGRDARKVIRLNREATLYDLCNFEYAVCWNNYLKTKMESETKLTDEDAELLKFCIAANLDMMDAIVCAVLKDMLCGFAGQYIDSSFGGGGVSSKLREQFVDGNEGVRNDIRNWASIYRAVHPVCVRKVLSEVIKATGNADIYRSGDEIKNDIVRWLNKRMPSVANWGEKNEIMGESMCMVIPGKEVRNLWTRVHERIKRYPARIAEIRKSIKGMKARGITDSSTMRYIEDIERETLNRDETFDCIIYDLTFCILTYRTLGRLIDCKKKDDFDDDRKMKEIASDYTYAICGTEMLKGLRSRYSASCYTEIIKFLKSDLGWFTQRSFKDLVNETKLYKITLQTDDGVQNNKLEAVRSGDDM